MTDVYLAYAREDRESVRILSEMLQFEGWDVWLDPSEQTGETSAAVDMKLASAGAIVVVWSGYSRHSDYVRSEAATGLYKNKLIQVALDTDGAPGPFDQVEVVDLGGWTGERDNPQWRRVTAAVRLYAGAPGSARPLVQHRAMSGPSYLEPSRRIAWGPIVATGLLILGGGGLWVADPFGWRATRTAVAAETPAPVVAVAETGEATARLFENTAESDAAWDRVNRKDPESLRIYAVDFPNTSSAETARSLLRVLDAQAWVEAVTADNDGGYLGYLKEFPAESAIPGFMAVVARERLASLHVEHEQAMMEIQKALASLGLYKGVIDGQSGDGTLRAVRQFARGQQADGSRAVHGGPRAICVHWLKRSSARWLRGRGRQPRARSRLRRRLPPTRRPKQTGCVLPRPRRPFRRLRKLRHRPIRRPPRRSTQTHLPPHSLNASRTAMTGRVRNAPTPSPAIRPIWPHIRLAPRRRLRVRRSRLVQSRRHSASTSCLEM